MSVISKYRNMSVQVKAALWYTICNFFQKGISFIIVPIYVRLLSTAEYGQWSVFQSWRDILIIFASLNLYCGVFTKTLVDIKEDRDRYTASMQGLGSIVTGTMFVVYLAFKNPINGLLDLATGTMLLLFVYFLVYPSFQFWSTRQRVEYKYKRMVLVTAAVSILTPLISILLLLNTQLRVKAVIYGYLIVQCAVGGFFYILQYIRGRVFYDNGYWRYALKFNIPLIPHYLSLIILGQADRIMIKNFCGDSDSGIYSFAYSIASVMNVFISAVNGSRVPWTYEQLKNRVYDGLKRITNILVIMMAGITLMVCLISPEIIGLLGTEDYSVAVYVIPVVTLGVYFTFVYDLYASIEFYYGSTKYVMYASVFGAILNIVLNYIFIPIFGFIAAAYTTLICYTVFTLMHYMFSRKVLIEQNISERVYNDRFVFALSVLITIVCLLSMLTFNYVVMRVILLLILASVCIAKRNAILGLLKIMRK